MPYGSGSDEEIEQRRQAAKKHGAYAYRERGEAALDAPQRSYRAELADMVTSRDEIIALMRRRAVDAVMMAEIVQNFIAEEVQAGKALSELTVLKTLPAFMNTAQRALKDLVELMPKQDNVLDMEADMLKVLKNEDEDES